ncbi:MAG: CotH kinase family protein, partial [Kiritimatiellae bacterium]|nr:CotH kinase family protein [Kiritimatiellia bacterium]
NVSSSPDGGDTGLDNADLTKFVVKKFNLPAWLNYLASARITQEMDDVWANVCAYYDNAEMKEGMRGTDTWMPLGYDFNLSFGQYYAGDIGYRKVGLMSTNDWFKSHPFYGGNRVRCWKQETMTENCNNGNDGFEAVWQSPKFRRLYLRRLRTLMDQELKEPGTSEADTPFMAKMREMANLMRADAASDQAKWPNNGTDDAIDVWTTRPADMDAGIDDIWNNYVVPRREHLYVTHSATNTTKAIGYASNRNAGIPEAQSPIAELAPNISLDMTHHSEGYVTVSNANNEVVDMSGWTLKFGVEWELPAGTVCDSNDCIYIVKDRRAFVSEHSDELTNQVIVGNATFGDVDTTQFESSNGILLSGISSGDNTIKFSAKSQSEADKIAKTAKPGLTEEDKKAELDVNYLTIIAEPVKEGKTYKLVVAVNPATVEKPEVDTSAAEPMTIEDDTEDSGKKTVSVSISNAIKGLWYGYEVSDTLGADKAFQNDADSFERATNATHKVTASPRDSSKTSGFFRVKVLPAKPQ